MAQIFFLLQNTGHLAGQGFRFGVNCQKMPTLRLPFHQASIPPANLP